MNNFIDLIDNFEAKPGIKRVFVYIDLIRKFIEVEIVIESYPQGLGLKYDAAKITHRGQNLFNSIADDITNLIKEFV